MDMHTFIPLCMELLGTVAFAVSGAMVGIQCQMDAFGVLVLGVITAVGGGITRDIIMGILPSALADPQFIVVAAVTAMIVFTVAYCKKEALQGEFSILYNKILLSMDSIGLGIFSVMGVAAGIRQGYGDNVFLLSVLGTLTGVGGGLLRDMMAGVPPYIFVKHIYALASIMGTLCFIFFERLVGEITAGITASTLVVIIRFCAAHYRWNLPRIISK